MRKTTLLLAGMLLFLGHIVNAQITTYPYSEDFEAGDGGWVADNATNGTWALGTPAATVINSAASGANSWTTNLTGEYNNSESSSVTSPVFDFSALLAPAITFNIWWESEFSWDGTVLQSSIDGGTTWQNVGALGDAGNWYTDGTINGNPGGQQQGWTGRDGSGSNGWVTASHALTGLAGEASVQLRFAFGSDGSVPDEGVAFDDVTVFEVTCPEPSALTFISATSSTANLSWTPGGGETAWEVVVQPQGTGIPTGAGTGTTLNTGYEETGLTPATNYEAYVRSDCGGEFSIWVGPLNFATECVTFVAPYTEGFENGGTIPLCWSMDGGEDWQFNTAGPNHVGNNGTLTGTTVTGNYYAVVDASGDDGVTTLTTPLVDVSTLTTPAITFYEISDNEGFSNSQLDVEVWDGAAWNLMGTYNTNTSGWEQRTINISTLTITGDVQARFIFSEVINSGDFYDDIAIDDVTFDELPSCVNPSNLAVDSATDTTATLSWVSNGTETAWEVVVQAPGSGAPTGAGDAAVTNPYTATGLTAATTYEYYIRADCGGGEFSDWIGPLTFDTECTTYIAPYTEGFENGGVIPLCWSMDGGEDWQFNTAGPNHVGDGGTLSGATATGNYYAVVDASGDDGAITLTTPLVDVSTLTTPALSFYEISDNEGNANSQLDVEVWDGAAWNLMGTYNTNTVGWELKIIDISTLTITGDVQARFIFSEVIAPGDFYDDIAIDDVTFDELPPCVIPGGIAANNIAGTSADITWMAGGGETAWEYVIQPAGTGEPTGAGTATTTTGFSATGLNYQTTYEIYVRSDCGVDGFSEWAGPITFTTTAQLNFSVDCAVGPENLVYCYEDNETNVFTFTSTDGSPLNFIINSGNVESCCDELVVYDTDGTELFNDTNGGNLSGLTFQSTGDTISFTIASDGSVNCQGSSTINPIDVTVSCATCTNPTATYQVVDDCANGDQFLVDVNITSLGDATSLSIEDNQGNPPVSVSATGVTSFGPYPFNTDIIFTVSNEQDVNCVITSPALQLAACPPVNDNCDGATVATVNDSFLCEVSTPGTLTEATPSGVPNPSCGGDPDDDIWFQFVATSEYQLIALANIQGSSTTNIDHAVYEGTCGTLTEISCTTGFTLLSSITPQLTIGNTYFIRIFSNGSVAQTTTFDLCITPYEAPTNITCDLTENLCPGGDDLYTYNTVGVLPGFGSIDCLGSSPNPTFSVIEIGTSGDIDIEMVQNTAFDSMGNPIGDELDVDFALWGPFNAGDDYCNGGDYPSTPVTACSYSAAPVENFIINNAVAGDIYILLITNFEQDPGIIQINQTNLDPNNPDPNAGTLSGEIEAEIISNDTVFIDEDNDETTPPVANLCGFDSIVLEVDSPFADTVEWYVNGILDPTLTTTSITVTESNSYTVTAYDNQCMGNDTSTVIVNLYQEPTVNTVPDEEVSITTCDDESGDGIEEFDFSSLSSIILDSPGQDPADFLVTYHETLNDAQSGTNALTSPYSATDGTIIYVRVEDVDSVGSGSGCASTNTTFELTVLGALPEISDLDDLELCDDESRDGTEFFDLEQNTPAILNGQDPSVFVVSYHETQADADAGANPLTSPYANTSTPQTIYARIQNNAASDCYKTTTFNLIVKDLPETTFDANVDYEVCPNATSPITITAIANNYTESEVTINWYYEGDLIAGQNDLTLDTVLLAGDYEIEVTFSGDNTQCTSSQTVSVIELESCIIPQGISPNGDQKNDTFDLSSFDVQSLTIFNRNGVKVYEKTN
ncbi:CHU domain-containing protein, partial [Lacinutrix venerupis]|uniref:fibronectin type III domain-containing protein n=1 Tax=Lacinutrix venerupis TaxID=1486034 RepID=UPI000EAEBC6E